MSKIYNYKFLLKALKKAQQMKSCVKFMHVDVAHLYYKTEVIYDGQQDRGDGASVQTLE